MLTGSAATHGPRPAPKPGAARGAGSSASSASLAPDDPVFAALREWRTAEAREAAVPPYVIAHDATLAAIAEARPTLPEALWRVKGMGPARVERYGEAILAVVARAAGED